jgi:glutathione reductase (NADPH)
MNKSYNLIVIGTGAGGSTAAYKCRKEGWTVAEIDHNPFGGTCALRGCDPKKVLVGAAELIDYSKRLNGKGVEGKLKINWKELIKFKRSFTEHVPENREKSFKDAGIETFHGTAKFISENIIEVDENKLIGKNILIANGAKPVKLNIEGVEYINYSDQFLELDELPADIIFVGGGYISFEFAHIAALAGSNVTILHRGKRPLEGFDEDLVELLIKKSKEIGIKVELNTEVKSISKSGDNFIVIANNGGIEKKFHANLVVHGAGRIPELDEMDLDKGNVKREKKGVTVNEYLQSITNPIVYSAGDSAATKGLPLTPVATMESHIAASNLLNGNKKKPDYAAIPTVVFTQPPLASVGLKVEDASEKGLKFDVNFKETSDWYSSKRINEKYSAIKTITEKDTGKILGAHLFGHNSEELINIFALAIKYKIPASELRTIIYSYPTRSSNISYTV